LLIISPKFISWVDKILWPLDLVCPQTCLCSVPSAPTYGTQFIQQLLTVDRLVFQFYYRYLLVLNEHLKEGNGEILQSLGSLSLGGGLWITFIPFFSTFLFLCIS
jgi:hypothetical protein